MIGEFGAFPAVVAAVEASAPTHRRPYPGHFAARAYVIAIFPPKIRHERPSPPRPLIRHTPLPLPPTLSTTLPSRSLTPSPTLLPLATLVVEIREEKQENSVGFKMYEQYLDIYPCHVLGENIQRRHKE